MTFVDLNPFKDGVPLKGVGPEHLRDRLILPSHLSSSAFGGVGLITSIDPNDAAVAGATGFIADAGHQHAFVTGTPVSVGTSLAEGSGNDLARKTHVHDINVPAVRAVWSANTSVPSNGATVTAIAFGGTDAYDTSTMHDPSTNNTRITMPVTSVYSVGGFYQMEADANNSGYRGIYLRVNGTTFIDEDERVTATFAGSLRDVVHIHGEYKFTANDYVELVARQINTVPASLNVVNGAFWASLKTKG